jgi:murein DD-endopeptidase MepM/ murein hydrolase activator NlpD
MRRLDEIVLGLSLFAVIFIAALMAQHTKKEQEKAVLLAQISRQQAALEQMENHIMEKRRAEAAALELLPPMAEFRITSHMGVRKSPMGGGVEKLHKGMDIVGPISAEILAAADGTVVEHWIPPDGGPRWKGHPVYGGMITIEHRDGVYTLYGHMKQTFVHEGLEIQAGDRIGIQGDTGISDGEHLHFEVIIDPELALQRVIPVERVGW